ncbi:Uncharacterised protein [Mycobacterium tuberculosis]|nr:Uncharacterised protein [Mycobacterium tuberculosis]
MDELEVVGVDRVLGDHLGMHLYPLMPRPAIGAKGVEPPRADMISEHRESVRRNP